MAPPADPALVHARALRGRGSTLPPGFTPPAPILDSWARSLDHGLDYAARMRLPVAEAADLARRRERAATVRRLARAEIETLMQQIAGSNYLLAFADADGVVLDVVADNRFAMSSDEEIVAGSCWREDVAGTNGLGTALATGRAIAVTGPEHYYLRLADISCNASPIRDTEGHIVGLLDASSYVQERQRHTLALVQMSTAHIENVLLAEQCEGDLLLAIHPRREFLRTLSAGVLAFNPEGELSALNARAQAMLSGLPAQRGARFEHLFGERFNAFVARLHAQGETLVHDSLGSALVARWIGRRGVVVAARPPRAAHAAAPSFVADDAQVAGALRVTEQALARGVPLTLRGARGSGKRRLAHEAWRGSGRTGTLTVIDAEGLDARRLREALAGLDSGGLLLHHIEGLGAGEQRQLLQALDARHEAAQATPLVCTLTIEAADDERVDADLRYRLALAQAELPALAARSDFAACAHQALAEAARNAHLDPLALAALAAHHWPGQWRELQAVLTRAALAARATAAHADMPVLIEVDAVRALLPATARPVDKAASVLHREATERVLRELDRQGGSVSAAARRLGISRNTVYRHLREAKRS